jgi:ribosomal protein S27E
MPVELTRRALPHLKRLTLPDLARRLFHDPALKRSLARAAVEELVGPHAKGYEEQLVTRFDDVLLALAGNQARRYHITCGNCDLSHLFETGNWRSAGVRVRCCVCDAEETVAMPEATERVRCTCCGNELTIKLVDLKV